MGEVANGFTLDLAYNGGGSEEWTAENGGTDALAAQLLADKAKFRWMNHTYTHEFLGCVQDVTVVPWKCKTNADGSTAVDEPGRHLRADLGEQHLGRPEGPPGRHERAGHR